MGRKKKTPVKKIRRKKPVKLLNSQKLLQQKNDEFFAKRAQVAALAQHTDLSNSAIAYKLRVTEGFVRKWKDSTDFTTSPRSGRPRTKLTTKNLKKLRNWAGKDDKSVRYCSEKLKMSKSSASRGFLEQGLKSFRKPKQSKLKKHHIKWRYECAKKFKDEPPEFWERFLITDEKLWTTNGMFNVQNDRVRAKKASDVTPIDLEKFPGRRMTWLGMSARGLTKLHLVKGMVNGKVYQDKILKKIIAGDVLKRKKKSEKITETKLFARNGDMIFEQDFATPHSTNANDEFMKNNFPNYTPTLHRYRGEHEYYFPPKMDDFWPIERLWAILAHQVYRNPRPKNIQLVMKRLRVAVNGTNKRTLIRLVHDLPAKMQEIYRMKGKKISGDFDPKKSPYACECEICSS